MLGRCGEDEKRRRRCVEDEKKVWERDEGFRKGRRVREGRLYTNQRR